MSRERKGETVGRALQCMWSIFWTFAAPLQHPRCSFQRHHKDVQCWGDSPVCPWCCASPSSEHSGTSGRRQTAHISSSLSVSDALGFSSLFENASLAHDQSVHPAQTPCIKHARCILMKCTFKLAVQLDQMRFLSLQPRSSVLPTSGRKLFQPDLTLYGHHNQLPSPTNK